MPIRTIRKKRNHRRNPGRRKMEKRFWKWRNETGEDSPSPVLELRGTIAEESWFDDDVTPRMFRDELMKVKGDITVWINSPGGDCIAASEIYTMLLERDGHVTVKIDGIAASAASVIAMAGGTVLMAPTSMMMVHNPITMAFGESKDMQKAIEMLNEVKESIINAYTLKTGMSRAKAAKLMDAETWMNAAKAIELGFADGMIGTAAAEDSWSWSGRDTENSLRSRITAKYRKPMETGTPYDALSKRLQLIRP